MFIAVDLKVIEGLAAAVGRSSGVSEESVGWGLVRLWHRCWADELDHLDRHEMAGIFGIQNLDLVTCALEAFGFLEASKTATGWRVCGASRYLRLKESRRRGGKAAAANLKRGKSPGSRAGPQPGVSQEAAGAVLGSLTESPNTEHRTPKEKLAGKKPPADPRLAPLTAWLVDVYAQERGGKYKHGGAKDALALKALLPIATDAEISDRWRLGLRATGWASCSTFAQLGSKWNDLAAPAKASGPVDAGTQAHTQTGYFE